MKTTTAAYALLLLALIPLFFFVLKNKLYTVTYKRSYIAGPSYIDDPTKIQTSNLRYGIIIESHGVRARDFTHR